MALFNPFSYLILFLFIEVEAVSSSQSSPPNTTSRAYISVNQSSISATTSNASAPLIANTTTTDSADFSYIIPYGQSQECDIYGPICQIGSITVGVNLTTATTSTILPCSSYLTAQSSYLEDFVFWPETNDNWRLEFGRSPECRSYAKGLINGQYTVSGCGDHNTVIQTDAWRDGPGYGPISPPQLPPGILGYFSDYYTGSCCGNCSLVVSEVRLYYFPDSNTPICQSNQTSNSSSILSARELEKRVHSLVGDGSIAVVSGHTFTSPSVYLQLVGTAAVSDECGAVGSTLTDPIITFPPGQLSTWKPPSASWQALYGMSYAVGDEWEDPIAVAGLGMVGELAPLTISDLACPTWGLGRMTSADGTVITTVGAPWLPVIAPPMEAFSLDPMWALICTGILTEQTGNNLFALYDPPIVLTRGSGLVPPPVAPVVTPTSAPATNRADPTTVADGQDEHSTEAAKPASSPVDPADPPARTGDPGQDGPSPSVAKADPIKPGSPLSDPVATPTNKSDPPSTPEVPAGNSKDPSDGQDSPLANPKVSKSDATQIAPADPKAPAQPAPQQVAASQPQTQGLGAIIYNAFGKSDPEVGGIANEINTISLPTAGVQEVSIGGGQVLSVDPSGVKFEGKTYSIGGAAMTISNSIYTIVAPQHGSGNNAADDDQNVADSIPAAPDTLTIAGQTVVPNPTGMIIAGSRVLPGSSAVTVSNTPVSLDPSGVLIVGSSSFLLPPQSVFTVGTQPFTANPTGFVLNGATISPGAAAQTVDGTIISLDHSGTLVLGSTTISLPSPSPTPALSPFTVAGQIFTPDPTAFSIAGTTISAGGPPITVAGTVISLGPSGKLIIGSTTISLPSPSPALAPLTVVGQTFTPNPTAFSIAGTTISAGGPAITLAGTVISLNPSGNLIIGSTTISLPSPSPTLSPLTIASHPFTPNPTAFLIAGTTISAGGPAITVSGTVISLERSGTLIIGSSTIPLLAPPTPSSPVTTIDGLSVEAESSLAVIDGVTVRPGAAAVTIEGQNVSLEPGGSRLDVGTGRFGMPTGSADGSGGVVAFEGGQGRMVGVSLVLVFGVVVGGGLVLMV